MERYWYKDAVEPSLFI